jgi:hypothetical protein
MIEKACAFEADSFVRVDSSDLAAIELLGGADEGPRPSGGPRASTAALPAGPADSAKAPALGPTEPRTIAEEPSDLAVVARGRGGIKRRRYELRISYYLSVCFRFGFLLQFLRKLLGNADCDPELSRARPVDRT